MLGAAYGYTFDHRGEVGSYEPTVIVAEIAAARPRRLMLHPRFARDRFSSSGRAEPDFIPSDEPRARQEVASGGRMWARFDYDDGLHPYRDIANGEAMLRFFPDLIEVLVFDDQAAAPTSPDAPLAP